MPIASAPMKITCQDCGWSAMATKQGDVIFIPQHCESCGSKNLQKSSASFLEKFGASRIQGMLKE
jgi:Zn finger protein HypA/HybF involved in hydrogenase expression